jgi:hypothetical protein
LFIEFRGAAEFLLLREAGKENPSRRKENPSLREGKSKPGEGKSKLFPSANRAFSKGCADAEAILCFSVASGEITS